MLLKLADLVQTFVEFFRIEDLDERSLDAVHLLSLCNLVVSSLAVERAQEMFSMLDINNDGDITEAEFIKVCLEDESLYHNLETKKPFSGSPRKDPVEAVDVPICPRFSLAAENRVTTKRRYSDICRKKKLLYNSDS